MNIQKIISSERQLVRLLQIGVVLEEIVEARSYQHYKSISGENDKVDDELEELLKEAQSESAQHRENLEDLIDELNASTVSPSEIEKMVENKYSNTKPENFEELLYDQLDGERSAYNFYSDLIEAIKESDIEFSIKKARLINILEKIKKEEAEGVREVKHLLNNKEWK